MISYYLLVTIMPLVRHPFWSDFVGDLTLIKYLGVLCLLYALFYLSLRPEPSHYFATWQSRFFVAFSLLAIILFFQLGTDMPFEVSPLMSYASFLAFFFVTLTLVDSLHRLHWTLLMAIASVAYASLHVIREWQKYGGMAAGYRPGFLTGDPNYYSLSALLCAPLAYYMLRTSRSPWERLFCAGALTVTLLGLTLAASRGGLLGMVVAILAVALRAPRRLRTLAVASAIVLPLLVIAPSSPLWRFLSPDAHDIYSAEQRMNLSLAGIRMFHTHLLTGVGPGNFKAALDAFAQLDEHHVAHNTYVSVMAEMGILGISLFIATLLATFLSLESVRRRALANGPALVAHTAEALQVGLAGFLTAAFFVSAETHRLIWLVVFLSMTLPPLVARSAAAAIGADTLTRGPVRSPER